jgi:hypothetical protein
MGQKYCEHQWMHVGGVVAAYTSEGLMPVEPWEQMIRDLQTLPIRGYLGTSEAAVQVTSTQRKMGVDAMGNRNLPTAIVTESKVVIGLVTTASWLGAKIRAFAWKDLAAATRYLGSSPAETEEIIAAIYEMRTSVLQASASAQFVI